MADDASDGEVEDDARGVVGCKNTDDRFGPGRIQRNRHVPPGKLSEIKSSLADYVLGSTPLIDNILVR